MSNSSKNKRRNVMIEQKNSNLWKDNKLLKNYKLKSLNFRLNNKKISSVNNEDNGEFAESKRQKKIKSKNLSSEL